MRALAFALCLLFAASAYADPDADLGKSVYARRCAACHGVDGKGDTSVGRKYHVADFSKRSWARHWSEKKVRELVEAGVPHKMPAWKGRLSDAELSAVSAYVRSLSKKAR